MTRQEAVVLSYLEWVRLINTGSIRLDERRITRWSPLRSEPSEIVAELMLGAPDLGTSANAFVLAVLAPDVLDRVRMIGIDLGRRLPVEMVKSFHSFSETARTIHGHDADKAGVEIALTPLAIGWTKWVESVEAAERQSRGTTLLDLMALSLNDKFDRPSGWVAIQESRIVGEKIARSRDTMFYGWACALNSVNARPGADVKLPADVREEMQLLQKEYMVDQPFLAAAPLLCNFVKTLAADGDVPTDLLALASLKQYERYVAKQEGAALDLDSLYADIDFLEGLDIGSATLFVQTLGERLPSELVRALKARRVRRPVNATTVKNAVDLAPRLEMEQERCIDTIIGTGEFSQAEAPKSVTREGTAMQKRAYGVDDADTEMEADAPASSSTEGPSGLIPTFGTHDFEQQ